MNDLSEVKQARDRHVLALQQKAGVAGVGYGFKKRGGQLTDELAVIVYVRKKLPLFSVEAVHIIPAQLDGVSTDVQEIPTVQAQNYAIRIRPVPGGVSLGHPVVTAGTAGLSCGLQKGGVTVALTNAHVACPTWEGAKVGDDVLQPGVYDGGVPEDRIGTVLAVSGILFDGSPNQVDGCLVAVEETRVVRSLYGLDGVYPDAIVEPVPGMKVQKVGRTTRHTIGVLAAVGAAVNVQYGPDKVAMFTDQLEVDFNPVFPFQAGGDSGNIWLTEDGKGMVGLGFAGGASQAFANDMRHVQAALGFGLIPAATETIEQQIESIMGAVEVVWGWRDGGWLVFVTGGSTGNNTLKVLERGFGYWVKFKANTSWVYHGFSYISKAGWQNIGWQG